MTSVSVVVDDIDSAVKTLCDNVGIPEPRPQSFREGQGIRAMFCRIHPKYAVAPTFLELVTPGPINDEGPHVGVFDVAKIAAQQGDRPIKLHASGVGMTGDTLDQLVDRLRTLQVPHVLAGLPPTARLLTGWNDSGSYDWDADAGLFFEGVPSFELQLSEEGFTGPADIPAEAEPTTMIRISAREYLVRDLGESLGILERNFGWVPRSVLDETECRRALMPFSAPRSAVVELVEPKGSGRPAEALERLGPGPWTIRVTVVDLAAKADDLTRRGTPFTMDNDVIRPAPDATLGVPFEFVPATR
jgi:hypothetical protein